ncbi:hypothetical protein JCM3766R1_002868 [Sporobolomyces carnicolor]
MSDGSNPPRSATARGTTERRAALDRRKGLDASSLSTRRKRPTFLGAEDDDDDQDASNGDAFDFEAFARKSSSSKRKQHRDATTPDLATRDDTTTTTSLGNGFDDLFNLDGPDADAAAADALKGDLVGDEDLAPAKKRRVVAKMDETRLLGPSGFPKLIQDIQRVKLKGKGHEAQDLKRVLSMYQLWTHQMYPKTNLRDTLASVEKLCHKRSAQRALKTYKDDWKNGRAASAAATKTGDDALFEADPETIARLEERDRDGAAGRTGAGARDSGTRDHRGGGRDEDEEGDTFDQAELDDLFGNGDDDDDALMAALEAEALAVGTNKTTKSVAAGHDDDDASAVRRGQVPPGNQAEEVDNDDDEAEAAMREMEALLA